MRGPILSERSSIVVWYVYYDDAQVDEFSVHRERKMAAYRKHQKRSEYSFTKDPVKVQERLRDWGSNTQQHEKDQNYYGERAYGDDSGSYHNYQQIDWSDSSDDMDAADFESQLPDLDEEY